jgi:hypothetical protein
MATLTLSNGTRTVGELVRIGKAISDLAAAQQSDNRAITTATITDGTPSVITIDGVSVSV